jgi:diacylglycerol O-acyltransferase / wax synthase
MRQLTSLDAQFLALENSRQTGHVGSLAMLDPSTAPGGRFGCREVTRLLGERAAQLPPLRWRLQEVPFGLDHPY